MPMIVAMCPYCRAGGVKAPDTAVGRSATCPSCKSNFTVVPSGDAAGQPQRPPDGGSRWGPAPAPPKPAWSIERAPDKPARTSPAVDETQDHGSPVAVTEPSPVLPAERPESTEPPTRTFALPEVPFDTGYAFALGAATLFGAGMAAAQFLPYGRAVGLGLCGLGAVGGLLSLGAEGRARLVAAGAAGVNLVAVLLLAFAPGFLGSGPTVGMRCRVGRSTRVPRRD